MGGVKQWVGIGAAVAVSLSLTACGGKSGTATAAATPSASAGAVDSPTPDAAVTTDEPEPSPTPSPSLGADALLAGLLPAADFGSGMKYDDGSPFDQTELGMGGPLSECSMLDSGGDRVAGIAVADAAGSPPHTSSSTLAGFFERAAQYNAGEAEMALDEMSEVANSTCAMGSYTLDSGSEITFTLKTTDVSGLGDQAVQFVDTQKLPHSTLTFETLTVRYGDVLLTADCAGPASLVKKCNLPAKVKKMAGLLQIG